MKPLLALVIAAMVAVRAFGTAQVPDKLILDGKEVPLLENPLEYLWLDENGTPVLFSNELPEPGASAEELRKWWAIVAQRPRRPDALFEGEISTGDWRGYVATWKLEGDRLLLVKVEQEHQNQSQPVPKDREARERWRPEWETREIPIERILPGKKLPVFAEWYSGKLRVPQGKMFDYAQIGYGPRSARDTFLDFRNGVLVSRVDIDNTGKNLYRTEYAQPWKTYGDEGGTVWSWIDPRLFNYAWIRTLMDSGVPFRTRGGFSQRPPGRDHLWLESQQAKATLLVYEIPERSRDAIPLHALPDGELPVDGTLVEIECRFVKGGERQELHVSSIRELKPSEALFHTDFSEFIEKWRSEMNADRERKAVEAKKAAEPAKAE